MKKIRLSLAAVVAFASVGSSLMADENKVCVTNPFVGGKSEKSIYVGLDRVNFKDSGADISTNGIVVGGEMTHTYDSNVYTGVGADIAYSRPELGVNGNTSVYTLGVNAKLGYAINPQLAMYGIVGGNYQKIDYDIDPTSGFGYVYGVGSEMKFSKDVVADIELKRGWVDANGDVRDLRYEYKTVGVKLKYLF